MLRDLASSRARISATRTESRPGDPRPPQPEPPAVSGRAAVLWRLAPLAVIGAVVGIFFALDPRPFDLAAHIYRAQLFESEGFTLWNGQWYGGHHTPAYSILFPPLAALFGPLTVGVASCFASAVLFDALARGRWGHQARWGSLWFAAGLGTILFTGRLPFGLGVALGLAALLAFQRDRRVLAAVFAVLCSLASPVSGAFLALAAFAYAISGEPHGRSGRGFRLRGLPTSPGDVRVRLRGSGDDPRGLVQRAQDAGLRLPGLALFAAALVPPVLLAFVFPEGGYQPFRFGVFIAAPICAVAYILLLPDRERALRAGAALYLLAVTAAFVIDTPMGSNAVRLGALFGGPLLACVLLASKPRRRKLEVAGLVLLFAAAMYWQWATPVRDSSKALADPGADSAYYDPLLDWLDEHDGGPPWRLHIPFSRSHFEAASVAPHYPLARGWERQVDTGRNRIFYDGYLTPLTYAAWLSEHGVRYVALPSVRPDFSSQTERGLIERGLPYLRLRWRSEDWRVYEFMLPHPLAVPEEGSDMTVTKLESDSLELDVRRPGEAILRVRWSPYWKAHGGCVERDGDWTRLTANEPGRLRVTMAFAPDRVLDRGRRCS